jgi:hypothetical protein
MLLLHPMHFLPVTKTLLAANWIFTKVPKNLCYTNISSIPSLHSPQVHVPVPRHLPQAHGELTHTLVPFRDG